MGNVTKIIHKKGGVKSIIDLNKTTNITQNIITNSTYQIGEYKESKLPLSDNETLTLLDGRILSNNSYELLFNHIRELLKTNPELFTDINTYNSEVKETGECHKFVYQSYQENDENYTLKLPTYDNREVFHYICTKLKNTNTDKNLVQAEVDSTYLIDPELADTFYITLTQADCHISIKQPTKPDFKYDLDVYFYQKVGNVKVTFDQNVRGINNDEIEITHARDYVTYVKLTSITQGRFWMYRKIDTWYGAALSDVKAPQYKVTLALSGVGEADWGRVLGHQSQWAFWAIPNNITFRDAYTDEPMNLKTFYGNQFIIGSRDLGTDTYKECLFVGYVNQFNTLSCYNIGTHSLTSQQEFDQFKMLETDIKGYFTCYSTKFDLNDNYVLAKTLSKNYADAYSTPNDQLNTNLNIYTTGHWTISKPTISHKLDTIKPSTIYYTLYTNHPLKEVSFKYGRSLVARGFGGERGQYTYINYSGVSVQKIKADLYYDDQLVKSQVFDIPNNGGETQCVIDCNDLVTDWRAELDAIEKENARLLAIEKAKSFKGVFNIGENTHAEVFRYVAPEAEESGTSTSTSSGTETEGSTSEKVLTKIYSLTPGENEVILKYDDIVRIYNDSKQDDVKFSYNKSVFKNKLGDFTSGSVLTYKTENYYELEIFRIYDNFVLNSATCQGAGSLETDSTTFIKLIRNNLINKFISFNELCYFDDIEIGDVIVPSNGAKLEFEKCNLVETGTGTNQFIVSELYSNYKIRATGGTLTQASGLVQTKDKGDIRIYHLDNKLVDISGLDQKTITLSVGDFVETNNVLSVQNVNLQDYDVNKKVVTAVFDEFVIVSQDVVSNTADTANGLVHNRIVDLLENASSQEANVAKYNAISDRTKNLNSNELAKNINNNINIFKTNINDLNLALSDAEVLKLDSENIELFKNTISELSDTVVTLENFDCINKYEIAIRKALNSLKSLKNVQSINLDSRYKGLVTKYNTVNDRIPVIKTTENINNDVTDICDEIDALNSDITQYETLHSSEFSKYSNEYETNLQLISDDLKAVNAQYSVVSTGSVCTNIDSIKRAVFAMKSEGTDSDTVAKNTAIDSLAVKLVNIRNSIENASNDIVQFNQTFNTNINTNVSAIENDFEALRLSDSVKIDNILYFVKDNLQIRTLILSVGEYDSKYTDPIISETGVGLIELDYVPVESSTETEA